MLKATFCLFIFSLLLTQEALSGGFLVLHGAPTGIKNSEDIELAEQVVRRVNRPVITAGYTGTSLTGKALDFPLVTEDDFRKAIRRSVKEFGQSGSITISFQDHGSSKGIVLSPSSLKFPRNMFPPQTLSFKKIERILKEEVPSKITIRLMVDACFSGGVHQISHHLKNVCSSSTTDHRSMAYAYPMSKNSPFQLGFWRRLESQPDSTNLYDLHTAGMNSDFMDGPKALLSSEAYIDQILRKGSYDSKMAPFFKVDDLLMGLPSFFLQVSPRLNVDIDHLPPFSATIPHNNVTACHATSTEVVSLTSLLGNIHNALNQNPLSDALSDTVGADIQNFEKFYSDARTRSIELTRKWDDQLKKWNALSKLEKREQKAESVRLFEALKKEKIQLKNDFLLKLKPLIRAKRVTDFLLVASPAQKAEYFRLLKCETEPL